MEHGKGSAMVCRINSEVCNSIVLMNGEINTNDEKNRAARPWSKTFCPVNVRLHQREQVKGFLFADEEIEGRKLTISEGWYSNGAERHIKRRNLFLFTQNVGNETQHVFFNTSITTN